MVPSSGQGKPFLQRNIRFAIPLPLYTLSQQSWCTTTQPLFLSRFIRCRECIPRCGYTSQPDLRVPTYNIRNDLCHVRRIQNGTIWEDTETIRCQSFPGHDAIWTGKSAWGPTPEPFLSITSTTLCWIEGSFFFELFKQLRIWKVECFVTWS